MHIQNTPEQTKNGAAANQKRQKAAHVLSRDRLHHTAQSCKQTCNRAPHLALQDNNRLRGVIPYTGIHTSTVRSLPLQDKLRPFTAFQMACWCASAHGKLVAEPGSTS